MDTAFLFDEFLQILRREGFESAVSWAFGRNVQGRSLTTIGHKHPEAITKALEVCVLHVL